MDWKRFQNGLSATIAHPAPLGEKNPTFPLAGEFPPFTVLLASWLLLAAWLPPPAAGRREAPAQPACGPFATF